MFNYSDDPMKVADVFFDVDELVSKNMKKHIEMSPGGFSPDGKYFSYFLKHSGSDWDDAVVRDTSTRKDIDRLNWLKFSGLSWTQNNAGFFYTTFDPPKN